MMELKTLTETAIASIDGNLFVRRNAAAPGVISIAMTRMIPTVWRDAVIVMASNTRSR